MCISILYQHCKKMNIKTFCSSDQDLVGKLLQEYGGAPSPHQHAPPVYQAPRPPTSDCRRSKTPVFRATTAAGVARAPSVMAAGNPRSGSAAMSNQSRGSTPAYKPRPPLGGCSAVLLPSQPPMEVQMPTTPLSVPYSPPVFLS